MYWVTQLFIVFAFVVGFLTLLATFLSWDEDGALIFFCGVIIAAGLIAGAVDSHQRHELGEYLEDKYTILIVDYNGESEDGKWYTYYREADTQCTAFVAAKNEKVLVDERCDPPREIPKGEG